MRRPLNAFAALLATAAVSCDCGSPDWATPSVTPVAAPVSAAPASAAPASAAPTPPPSASPAAVAAAASVALPNPALTPGEVFPGATAAQVCVPGYSKSVRNVTLDQYREVYAEYGLPYPEPAGTYELDHLVPLELGGDNANRNLWPQPAAPAPGFHQKDDLENYLHEAVCSGRLALPDVQRRIAADWYALYREYLNP